jgi:DNA-binding SARP family transcriptional activator
MRVRLLGDLAVELDDGRAVALPAGSRARALVAWLALHPGPQPRHEVAARLWPDVLDASARSSLRSTVWALRKGIGAAAAGLLAGSRDTIALGGSAPWVDVLEFDRLLAAGRPAEALELCAGELAPELQDEWVLAARDAHRERRADALAALADGHERAGDVRAAVAADRRRLALDPLDEPACRDLMRRLAAAGDRAGAMAAYARLRDRMRRDLALSPSPESRAAMLALRDGPADASPADAAPPEGAQPDRAHLQ